MYQPRAITHVKSPMERGPGNGQIAEQKVSGQIRIKNVPEVDRRESTRLQFEHFIRITEVERALNILAAREEHLRGTLQPKGREWQTFRGAHGHSTGLGSVVDGQS